MGSPEHTEVCTPCSKANHQWCLYDVVVVATGLVDTCACDLAEHETCESCGHLLHDPADCDHKTLCTGCANECRVCVDADAREETLTRRAG